MALDMCKINNLVFIKSHAITLFDEILHHVKVKSIVFSSNNCKISFISKIFENLSILHF